MFKKFLEKYELILEDVSSQRKPIQKVDAMNPHDFLKFLREFIPYVKDGRVDLNDIRITEKVDGQSLKVLTQNGHMMFESSYSGVTTWDKVPMKDAAEFLYKNYSQLFNDIYELIGFDFKLIGELIWINGMAENGKITPVGASYLTEKFGSYGGMVVFDILKIENDKLVQIPDDKEKEIFDMIRDLNNEDFSFYLSDSIDITKNVNFVLDIDEINKLLNDPNFNKDRFNKKTDAKLIEVIENIKQNVCDQLSQTIDQTKGAFSDESDLIEGIVVKINKSGNQYGMFSSGYRDMKSKYWEDYYNIEKLYSDYFKSIFNYLPTFKKKYIIPALKNDINQFSENFKINQPTFYQMAIDLFNKLETNTSIPISAKAVQLSMAKKILEKISENNYIEFIKKYVDI